jgi:hypothetical protein
MYMSEGGGGGGDYYHRADHPKMLTYRFVKSQIFLYHLSFCLLFNKIPLAELWEFLHGNGL